MEVTVAIPDELAELAVLQAKMRGIPLEAYLRDLIEQAAPKPYDSASRTRTVGEFQRWLEEYTRYSEKMPLLSDRAISRDAIYEDGN